MFGLKKLLLMETFNRLQSTESVVDVKILCLTVDFHCDAVDRHQDVFNIPLNILHIYVYVGFKRTSTASISDSRVLSRCDVIKVISSVL